MFQKKPALIIFFLNGFGSRDTENAVPAYINNAESASASLFEFVGVKTKAMNAVCNDDRAELVRQIKQMEIKKVIVPHGIEGTSETATYIKTYLPAEDGYDVVVYGLPDKKDEVIYDVIMAQALLDIVIQKFFDDKFQRGVTYTFDASVFYTAMEKHTVVVEVTISNNDLDRDESRHGLIEEE